MNRNLLLLWGAHSTFFFGSSVYTLVLTLLSLQYGESALGAGAMLFTSFIPYLSVGVIAGAIVDRVNRKRLMVICESSRVLLTISIPIALSLDALTLPHILLVSILMTCLRSFSFPATQSSVPLLIDGKKNLTKVHAYIGSTSNLGLMLGPSLGGVLLLFDMQVAELLYITTASNFISLVLISFIRYPSNNVDSTETKESVEMKKLRYGKIHGRVFSL